MAGGAAMGLIDLQLAEATPVNGLWSELLERLGAERAQLACRQALDLQGMRGEAGSLPVLLVETCGVSNCAARPVCRCLRVRGWCCCSAGRGCSFN